LSTGKKGGNLSLDMTFKIWEGLGGDLFDPICDLGSASELRRINTLGKHDREIVLDVIKFMEGPEETIEKNIIRRIIKSLRPIPFYPTPKNMEPTN
jgi:hypothetical protein